MVSDDHFAGAYCNEGNNIAQCYHFGMTAWCGYKFVTKCIECVRQTWLCIVTMAKCDGLDYRQGRHCRVRVLYGF